MTVCLLTWHFLFRDGSFFALLFADGGRRYGRGKLNICLKNGMEQWAFETHQNSNSCFCSLRFKNYDSQEATVDMVATVIMEVDTVDIMAVEE